MSAQRLAPHGRRLFWGGGRCPPPGAAAGGFHTPQPPTPPSAARSARHARPRQVCTPRRGGVARRARSGDAAAPHDRPPRSIAARGGEQAHPKFSKSAGGARRPPPAAWRRPVTGAAGRPTCTSPDASWRVHARPTFLSARAAASIPYSCPPPDPGAAQAGSRSAATGTSRTTAPDGSATADTTNVPPPPLPPPPPAARVGDEEKSG